MQFLIELDEVLFLALNGLNSSFVDPIMWAVSGKFIWIPFYLFLLYLLIKDFGWKTLYLMMAVVLVVLLCDQLSVHAFKNVFQRLRPCHNPEIMTQVHLVNDYCGGKYGFVSSHAANTFGLAVFLGLVFRNRGRNWMIFLLLWALFVSYSRIYLGVHYPLDILGGAALGSGIGYFIFWTIRKVDATFKWHIFKQ